MSAVTIHLSGVEEEKVEEGKGQEYIQKFNLFQWKFPIPTTLLSKGFALLGAAISFEAHICKVTEAAFGQKTTVSWETGPSYRCHVG